MGWWRFFKASGPAPMAAALDDEIARLERLAIYGWQGASLFGFVVGVAAYVLVPGFGAGPVAASAALLAVFAMTAVLPRRGRAAVAVKWVNPLLESAVPWTFVFLLMRTQGAEYALGSWVPPMVWGGVMAVGMLRLRPVLPFVVGVLGAVQYESLYLFAVRGELSASALGTPLFGAKMQIVRSLSLVATGIFAAGMTFGLRRAIGKAATSARAIDLFGKYRLERPIASGGMATVYAATYCPEGGFARPVAIKRIHPHLAREAAFVDSFRNEAELCSRLLHPNIVQVFDFGRVDETYFLAMEFVDGVTLGALMRTLRAASIPMSPAVVASIGRDMLEGLAYSHTGARDAAGNVLRVVHRDLSPANVLVSKNGQVKISDFGLARALRNARSYSTDSIAGHLSYMAPEQATGEQTDERSDLFSMGVILWELLAGAPLFRRQNEAATLLALLNDPAPAPSSLRSDLGTADWDGFFTRALDREPERRYPTAREMGQALAAIQERAGAPARNELGDLVARVASDAPARGHRDDAPTVTAPTKREGTVRVAPARVPTAK